jgi:molecular chaperone DnaJ
VSRQATQDEIKKAYRRKARENHPDTNPGDPGAEKRMHEINEAYDRIMNPQKYVRADARSSAQSSGYPAGGSSYGGQGGGYGWGGAGSPGSGQGSGQQGNPYDWPGGFDFGDLFGGGWAGNNSADVHPEVAVSDSPEVRSAISEINAGNHAQAVRTLSGIPSIFRDARWQYLCAIANHGAGNTISALEQIGRAVQMDPGNASYLRTQRAFKATAQTYTQQSQARGFSFGAINPATLCCGIYIAQYLVRFFCAGF